ncbi:hypothetical protein WR25_25228 [Diploscapter pachys]|uniref:G-protein coupled receptors family 1 profile domain-containing protein n=1 Tax=Diploscapter pachys TaxID=2018661 RepID=A0A2A2KEY1_9BILA|nr:hypothetical protein WR25_25228 [Diploscapter pachys]
MLSKDLYKHSAYKIMALLSVIDVCGITSGCLFFGYFMYHGYVFCSSPNVMYVYGSIAISRIVINYYTSNQYFSDLGSRTYIMLLIPISWTVIILLWHPPCILNSAVGAELNDPLIFPNRTQEYIDYKQHFNNAFFGVGNVVLYAALYLLFHKKFAEYFNEVGSRRDKYMFLQVVIIAILNIIVCFLFILLLYFPMPAITVIIAHATYQMIHCSPSFIYLLMNKSIRKEIGRKFCGMRYDGRSSSKIGKSSIHPSKRTTVSNDRNSNFAREVTQSSSSQMNNFA